MKRSMAEEQGNRPSLRTTCDHSHESSIYPLLRGTHISSIHAQEEEHEDWRHSPKELSGSERSDREGTFRIEVTLPDKAGTRPSSSASEASSCFSSFAITVSIPLPSVIPLAPRKLPMLRASRW